jgi:hypothetical protein
MVEVANNQFRRWQSRGELQKVEESQGIDSAGYADQDPVAQSEETALHDVIPEVVREKERATLRKRAPRV